MKRAVQRFVILDVSPGEYNILFRDPLHFKKTVRALVAENYTIFERDDQGRAHLIKSPKI